MQFVLQIAGMHTLTSWIIFLPNAFTHRTLTGLSSFYRIPQLQCLYVYAIVFQSQCVTLSFITTISLRSKVQF